MQVFNHVLYIDAKGHLKMQQSSQIYILYTKGKLRQTHERIRETYLGPSVSLVSMTCLFYVPKANQIYWLRDWEQRVSEMFKLIRLMCD